MTDKQRVTLYAELLFGAYSIIAVVCLSYYLDIELPVNQFEKCDIFHENASHHLKCTTFD